MRRRDFVAKSISKTQISISPKVNNMIVTCKNGHKYNNETVDECPICKYGEPNKGRGYESIKYKKINREKVLEEIKNRIWHR